jgi:hypothetical protein
MAFQPKTGGFSRDHWKPAKMDSKIEIKPQNKGGYAAIIRISILGPANATTSSIFSWP